jgi:hypothetical protein
LRTPLLIYLLLELLERELLDELEREDDEKLLLDGELLLLLEPQLDEDFVGELDLYEEELDVGVDLLPQLEPLLCVEEDADGVDLEPHDVDVVVALLEDVLGFTVLLDPQLPLLALVDDLKELLGACTVLLDQPE